MTRDRQLEVAAQALWDILHPIAKIRREMKPGYVLNGMAHQIATDPEHLRLIARDALRRMGRKYV